MMLLARGKAESMQRVQRSEAADNSDHEQTCSRPVILPGPVRFITHQGSAMIQTQSCFKSYIPVWLELRLGILDAYDDKGATQHCSWNLRRSTIDLVESVEGSYYEQAYGQGYGFILTNDIGDSKRFMMPLEMSRDAWVEMIQQAIRALEISERSQVSDGFSVEIAIRVSDEAKSLREENLFVEGMVRDVAFAVHGDPDKISVSVPASSMPSLPSGRQIHNLILEKGMCGVGVQPLMIAQELQQQVDDANSALRLGTYSRKITNVTILSSLMNSGIHVGRPWVETSVLPPAIVTEDLMMAISTENAPKRGDTAKTSSLSAKGTCELGIDAALESLATLNSLANIPSNDIIIVSTSGPPNSRAHAAAKDQVRTKDAFRPLTLPQSAISSSAQILSVPPRPSLVGSQAASPVFPWSEARSNGIEILSRSECARVQGGERDGRVAARKKRRQSNGNEGVDDDGGGDD